jgi:UDP-glucose 4-epimerase
MVAELTGAEPDPILEPAREGDMRRTSADMTLAEQLLGHRPAVDMREGLARTVEWFREHVDVPA